MYLFLWKSHNFVRVRESYHGQAQPLNPFLPFCITNLLRLVLLDHQSLRNPQQPLDNPIPHTNIEALHLWRSSVWQTADRSERPCPL